MGGELMTTEHQKRSAHRRYRAAAKLHKRKYETLLKERYNDLGSSSWRRVNGFPAELPEASRHALADAWAIHTAGTPPRLQDSVPGSGDVDAYA